LASITPGIESNLGKENAGIKHLRLAIVPWLLVFFISAASSSRSSAARRLRGRSPRAQQTAMPVIGFVNGASPDGYASNMTVCHQGLKEAGYVDGRNATIEYR
jgi:hypothetical protein